MRGKKRFLNSKKKKTMALKKKTQTAAKRVTDASATEKASDKILRGIEELKELIKTLNDKITVALEDESDVDEDADVDSDVDEDAEDEDVDENVDEDADVDEDSEEDSEDADEDADVEDAEDEDEEEEEPPRKKSKKGEDADDDEEEAAPEEEEEYVDAPIVTVSVLKVNNKVNALFGKNLEVNAKVTDVDNKKKTVTLKALERKYAGKINAQNPFNDKKLAKYQVVKA
jgi:hypothetical protein